MMVLAQVGRRLRRLGLGLAHVRLVEGRHNFREPARIRRQRGSRIGMGPCHIGVLPPRVAGQACLVDWVGLVYFCLCQLAATAATRESPEAHSLHSEYRSCLSCAPPNGSRDSTVVYNPATGTRPSGNARVQRGGIRGVLRNSIARDGGVELFVSKTVEVRNWWRWSWRKRRTWRRRRGRR